MLPETVHTSYHLTSAVLDLLLVVITTWPEGEVDWLEAPMHPKRPELGQRSIPFTREVLIERSDFEEEPPPKYRRLKPGGEVRLRYGYVLTCDEVNKRIHATRWMCNLFNFAIKESE